MPEKVCQYIEKAIAADASVKPLRGLAAVRANFPRLGDTVTDSQIRSKFSSVKTYNNRQDRSI